MVQPNPTLPNLTQPKVGYISPHNKILFRNGSHFKCKFNFWC